MERLTLYRPMQLFKGTLGLMPGIPSEPSLEGLFTVVFGDSADNHVRTLLGSAKFKTFENARRGRHTPSTTSVKAIRHALGDFASLCFAGGAQPSDDKNVLLLSEHATTPPPAAGHVPLLPELLTTTMEAGRFLERLRSGTHRRHDPRCPHCNHAFTVDPIHWWQQQQLVMDAPAVRFTERALELLVFAEYLSSILGALAKSGRGASPYSKLLDPRHTPIGNWLIAYQTVSGCENLRELSLWLLQKDVRYMNGRRISHDLLKKWSGRYDLMPPRAARALLSAVPQDSELHRLSDVARWFTFICDFIHASVDASPPPSWATVQSAVGRRYDDLTQLERLRRANTLRPVPRTTPKVDVY